MWLATERGKDRHSQRRFIGESQLVQIMSTIECILVTAGIDIEVNGGNPKPWSVALSESELSRVLKLAVNEFNSRDFSYEEWFFGLSEKNIPKWAGYSIGFDLVKKYILKSGKKASELVFEPAETFWDK